MTAAVWGGAAGLAASPVLWAGIVRISRRPLPAGRWWPAGVAAVAVLVGAWAGTWAPLSVAAAWWLLLQIGFALAVVDLREHRLPDPLLATAGIGVTAAVTAAAAATGDWTSWWQAAVSATAAFVVFYALAVATGMGYGDVKLAAVIAGCAGYTSPTAAAAALLGGLLAGGLAGMGALAAGRGRRAALALGPWLLLGAAGSLAVPGVG